MNNPISWSDVAVTVALMFIVICGFLFELAGETVPGLHTISWWAHKKYLVRAIILAAVAGLFVLLLFHFAGTRIGR